MIDQATIDKIMSAAQIVDVVSEFVTLRKRGVNYVGLCPFHNEKTPSFSVSPAKGLCKCFSCGKGGNVVHFIMEHEQLSYHDALMWLARKYHIEVKERELTDEEKHAQSVRESMFVVNDFARGYFQDVLRNHPEGRAVGMAYFRQRGFRDDIIAKFQLGYCLNQHDAFAREATQRGYKAEYLTRTGLCYTRDDGTLRDRFRGRVIFPVHTLSGKVVAFGGRVLKTDAKTAKYVNSPESEIYHKSNELYGIYFAKQAIVRQDRCFLVEGYTDVISMHQSGIENVVASSGTSLTQGQIRLIHRFTNNITVLYDGDMAGIKASLRGIDMLLEEGMNIKVVLLPDGDDPDSFARKHNATDYQQYINSHEVDFIRFKTNLLLDDAGTDPIKRAGLISDIVRSIAVIPDAIVRSVYVKECSQLLQVDEKLLLAEINKLKEAQAEKEYKARQNAQAQPAQPAPDAPAGETPEAGPAPEAPQPPQPPTPYESYIPQDNAESRKFFPLEKLIMELVVRYGEKTMCNVEDDEGRETPLSVVEFVVNELQIDDLRLHNPLHRRMLAEAAALMEERYTLSKYHTKAQRIATDEERLMELVPHVMTDFKFAIVEEELKHTQQALLDPENLHDEARYLNIMRHYKELSEVQRLIARRLGDRVLNV